MRTQLLHRIHLYLIRMLPYLELESWLIEHLQQILDSGEAATIELANQVDADLVELGEGLLTEQELSRRLERYLRLAETITADFSGAARRTETYTSTGSGTLILTAA